MSTATEYPAIDPVPQDQRPFWSVIIPTYNCANTLVHTLKSVLQQDPGSEEMHIEVVDDCSTKDDPEAVVKEIGKGRVSFYRQPQNRGAPVNFTTCVQRSLGHWVHILHGDDMVMPGFYKAYRHIIEAHRCSMVVAPSILVDEQGEQIGNSKPINASDGLLNDGFVVLAKENSIRTPAVVVARTAYEKVGGFNPTLIHSNDWEMWTRIAAQGSVGYLAKPYTMYRKHAGSDTGRLTISAGYVTDSLKALEIIKTLARNEDEQKQIQHRFQQRKSSAALSNSRKLARKGYFKPALLSAFWSIKLQPSLRGFGNIGYVAAVSGIRNVWGKQ